MFLGRGQPAFPSMQPSNVHPTNGVGTTTVMKVDLKCETACPAAWPVSYIILDQRRRQEREDGNPWHKLSQKLEQVLAQDRSKTQ
eukprot:s108_g25.t1